MSPASSRWPGPTSCPTSTRTPAPPEPTGPLASSPNLVLGIPVDHDLSDDIILDEHEYVVSYNPEETRPELVGLEARSLGPRPHPQEEQLPSGQLASSGRVPCHHARLSPLWLRPWTPVPVGRLGCHARDELRHILDGEHGAAAPRAECWPLGEARSPRAGACRAARRRAVHRGRPDLRRHPAHRSRDRRPEGHLEDHRGAQGRADGERRHGLDRGHRGDHAEPARRRAAPWTDYVTSVDEIEKETGYDFLARVPDRSSG